MTLDYNGIEAGQRRGKSSRVAASKEARALSRLAASGKASSSLRRL
jgi:hypothetical protein